MEEEDEDEDEEKEKEWENGGRDENWRYLVELIRLVISLSHSNWKLEMWNEEEWKRNREMDF